MINPVRQELLQSIGRLSELAPDLRLGQLIANLTMHAAGPWDQKLWDVEDQQLLEEVRAQIADLARRQQQGVA